MAHRSGNVILLALFAAIMACAQALPRVLIIGDSISIAYTPLVQQRLAGKADVERIEGNSYDSANVAAKLDRWLAKGPYAVISFNCGLHDLKFTEKTRSFQSPPEQYAQNLPRIITRLRASGAKLVWVTITPVHDARHARRNAGFSRYERDVVTYNKIATPIIMSFGIPIVDAHKTMADGGIGKTLGKDGVHLTDQSYFLLSDQIVAAILALLP